MPHTAFSGGVGHRRSHSSYEPCFKHVSPDKRNANLFRDVRSCGPCQQYYLLAGLCIYLPDRRVGKIRPTKIRPACKMCSFHVTYAKGSLSIVAETKRAKKSATPRGRCQWENVRRYSDICLSSFCVRTKKMVVGTFFIYFLQQKKKRKKETPTCFRSCRLQGDGASLEGRQVRVDG